VAPLHAVAQNGYATTVTLLLDDGVEAKVANNCGYTTLHLAAQDGLEK
jgi:hypothetical protein